METLRDLVDLAKQRQGVKSGRQLAQRAQDHGFQIDRTQLNDMASGRYKAVPHQTTIEALVWLTGADEDRVRQAAGLAAKGEPFVPHPDADLLSTEEREVVNNLIRTMTKGRRTPQVDFEGWTEQTIAELLEEPGQFKQGDVFDGVSPDLFYRDGNRVIVVEAKYHTQGKEDPVREALRNALTHLGNEVLIRTVQGGSVAHVTKTQPRGDFDISIDTNVALAKGQPYVDDETRLRAEERAREAFREVIEKHDEEALERLDSDEADDSTDRGA